jgi:hypothetical protein
MKFLITFIVMAFLALTITLVAQQESCIDWYCASSGGSDGGSSNFVLQGTAGQSVVGVGHSGSFRLSHGYWQEPTVGGPGYICGDTDGNSIVNISDAAYLIAYIFGGGEAPDPLAAADCDCNGIVNITDVIYLIAYIFGAGPVPCEACP